jgi:hypothetical protein
VSRTTSDVGHEPVVDDIGRESTQDLAVEWFARELVVGLAHVVLGREVVPGGDVVGRRKLHRACTLDAGEHC